MIDRGRSSIINIYLICKHHKEVCIGTFPDMRDAELFTNNHLIRHQGLYDITDYWFSQSVH